MNHQRRRHDLRYTRGRHPGKEPQRKGGYVPASAEHQEGQHAQRQRRAIEVADEVGAIDTQYATNLLLHRRADVLEQRSGDGDRYPERHVSSQG